MNFIVTRVEHHTLQEKPKTHLELRYDDQCSYISIYIEPPDYSIKLGDIYQLTKQASNDTVSQ